MFVSFHSTLFPSKTNHFIRDMNKMSSSSMSISAFCAIFFNIVSWLNMTLCTVFLQSGEHMGRDR